MEMRSRRYYEGSTSMKRPFDSSGCGDDAQPEKKRPALASVIVEALKVDSLQRLCSSLEPILRRVVSEEVERALSKLGPAKLNSRSSPKRIKGPDGRSLRLQFKSTLSLPLFTGGKVEGEQGTAIHVVLLDANTSQIVTSGLESAVKLDVVVLEGDFNNEEHDDWTQEEFESHLVREREGKRPLLTGDLQVTLKDGVGTLGELTFTDNSSWIRSRKFRLGLKVASGFCEGVRIREAKTEAFTVKDHRGELYKKHYPPALHDEVWRLEKIGKDGSFHKRLNKAGVRTVEDFLRLVVRDSQRLRNILGSGMSNKMWDVLVEHAKTCALSEKVYIYHPDETRNIGVIFNHIYELIGIIAGGGYHSVDSLSDAEKVSVDAWVKQAYENWMHVIEYDGKCLLSTNQTKNEAQVAPQDYLNSYDHQLSFPSMPVAPMEQPSIHSNLAVGGYNHTTNTLYPTPSQNVDINGAMPFDDTLYPPQNQLAGTSHQPQLPKIDNELALGPPEPSALNFQPGGTLNPNSFRGLEDFKLEQEIRERSNKMLENEDMQHLLHVFSMNAHGQSFGNMSGNGYDNTPLHLPDPSLHCPYDDGRNNSSGKAVVGWLKLKAALRWGIFIRKQAAERRAHLVELDDL
ncbi:Calmodulin binding protein, C-terminal domain [Dillenia turbinata]|uniref:Calmodulin binding protein, C-terminal domain n=1 Tax=Dillenia turbinata TaxID=194707 RepID=A0AAN8UXY9_9MAGN